MQLNTLIIYAVSMHMAFSLSACSGSSGSQSQGKAAADQAQADQTSPGSAGNESTTIINGKNPEAYYAQFYFKDHGCDDKLEKIDQRFDFLKNEWMTIGKTEDGHTVKGTVMINLYPDHSFYAIFQQDIILKVYPNGIDYETDSTKSIVKGTWHIDNNGDLVFPRLGAAKGITYNGHESLIMKPVSEFQFDPKNPADYLLQIWSGNTDPSNRSSQCPSDSNLGG